MAEKLTERFEMRLSEEGVAKLDEWRRQQPDLPSRAEAIRRLIERGFAYPEMDAIAKSAVSLLGTIQHANKFPQDFEVKTNVLLEAWDRLSFEQRKKAFAALGSRVQSEIIHEEERQMERLREREEECRRKYQRDDEEGED